MADDRLVELLIRASATKLGVPPGLASEAQRYRESSKSFPDLSRDLPPQLQRHGCKIPHTNATGKSCAILARVFPRAATDIWYRSPHTQSLHPLADAGPNWPFGMILATRS